MKKILFLLCFYQVSAFAQSADFPTDPAKVRFITSDIPNFWAAFDSVGVSAGNPFDYYIKRGSKGLQGFVPDRIISADSLLSKVKQKKAAYETKRDIETKIRETEQKVIPFLYKLKELYPKTKFPPVYFIMGRFNSGGTSMEDGLLIGAEMLNDLNGLPTLVVHESIHFQQTFPKEPTLLEMSLLEGVASFMAALTTQTSVDPKLDAYANLHKDKLLAEFVDKMNKDDYIDWLYGTSKKDDRPNDLGYWMGFKIAEAYYNKMNDKQAAIDQIINIKDYKAFVKQSGFLDAYLK